MLDVCKCGRMNVRVKSEPVAEVDCFKGVAVDGGCERNSVHRMNEENSS